MTTAMADQDLLALAERACRGDGPDVQLDADIAVATGEGMCRYPTAESNHKLPVENRYGHGFYPKPYTSSLDAAMSLVPVWLTPTIVGHDREVRLYNGIGLAVRGNDHLSVAASLCRGLTAAALRARADATIKKEESRD